MTEHVMSIEEVVDSFSEGLDDFKRAANWRFVAYTHASLKDGGIWASPNLGRVFSKSGEGFIELNLDPSASLGRPPYV